MQAQPGTCKSHRVPSALQNHSLQVVVGFSPSRAASTSTGWAPRAQECAPHLPHPSKTTAPPAKNSRAAPKPGAQRDLSAAGAGISLQGRSLCEGPAQNTRAAVPLGR